jgi:uncharacterized damage-inducible protein DinB
MSRVVVDQLLSMLDQSFERAPDAGPTDGWHSLMANLESVRDEDWKWLPADGKRTICHLAIHCGFAMRMYADRGFGGATLEMGDAVFPQTDGTPTKAAVLPWLREANQMLRDGLDGCVDDSLGDVRVTHWGERKTRRWFIVTMIEHNIYHAGEINHIRALAQRDDK